MSALQLDLNVPVTTLVLIGGGEFSFGETRAIDEFLVSKMPAERRTVAFLPTASGSAEYAGHFGTYLHSIDSSIVTVNVPVYRGRDGRRPKHAATLRSAGMIYLGGGVTNNLLEGLSESAAELAMREAASDGAVVAAIGAAASCFGAVARDMRGVTPSLPALGWIAGAALETGFDPASDEMLRRLMSVPEVTVGIGIPSRTALVVLSDGSTEIVGEGKITAYRKR